MQWVDPVWSSPLSKHLLKLWEMFSGARDGRVCDALNNLKTKFKFQDAIAKLHRDLRIAQDELKQVVEEKQALVDARDELQEKKKLDASTSSMIEDVLKQKEGFRAKIKKIKDTCDE